MDRGNKKVGSEYNGSGRILVLYMYTVFTECVHSGSRPGPTPDVNR